MLSPGIRRWRPVPKRTDMADKTGTADLPLHGGRVPR
jgi:hypothetical protein